MLVDVTHKRTKHHALLLFSMWDKLPACYVLCGKPTSAYTPTFSKIATAVRRHPILICARSWPAMRRLAHMMGAHVMGVHVMGAHVMGAYIMGAHKSAVQISVASPGHKAAVTHGAKTK